MISSAPMEDRAEKLHDFNKRVEAVARDMCEQMSLDPNALIPAEYDSDKHYGEQYWPPLNHAHRQETAKWPDGSVAATRVSYDNCNSTTLPRWRTLRPQAALALAGWQAVHRTILTEDQPT